MSVVFEGNTSPVSHNGKWSQWDLEPGYLILIRTCYEAALTASTVHMKFSYWAKISDGEGCLALVTGSQQVVCQGLYSKEYEAILSLTCFFPCLLLPCVNILPHSACHLLSCKSWRDKVINCRFGISMLKKHQQFWFSKVKLFYKEWSF